MERPSSENSRYDLTYLIYETTPQYDAWLKLVLGGILAMTLIPAIALLNTDLAGAWAMLGSTLLVAVIFYAVLPRRFQIFHDKIRIILGYPLAFNIPFSTIKEVRLVSGRKALMYGVSDSLLPPEASWR